MLTREQRTCTKASIDNHESREVDSRLGVDAGSMRLSDEYQSCFDLSIMLQTILKLRYFTLKKNSWD